MEKQTRHQVSRMGKDAAMPGHSLHASSADKARGFDNVDAVLHHGDEFRDVGRVIGEVAVHEEGVIEALLRGLSMPVRRAAP